MISPPKLVVYIIPLAALENPRLGAAEVKKCRPSFLPSDDASEQHGSDERQWWSNDPPRRLKGKPNPEAHWFFRLVRPGIFEATATIGERIDDDPDILVEGGDIERFLVSGVDRAAEVAHMLGLGGPALVGASLEGMEDVEIHGGARSGPRMKQPAVWLEASKISNLTAPAADQLRDMMDRIWLAGGWDEGSPNFSGGHWTGYSPI